MGENVLELWPREARTIIDKKGLSPETLKTKFKNILFPWDSNYDQRRLLFSLQIQERPLFIIIPIGEKEVKRALNLLRDNDLTLRIVGGRHSSALQNPDIFLDISLFNGIILEKNLKVGGGATQGEVNEYLFRRSEDWYFPGGKPNHPTSLAFPGGSASTVGVSGISTVGGIGTLRRTLGLTVDNIKSFRIVVPPTNNRNAITLMASSNRNSNLFWALLGGGGANFGVVTEIIYRPVKVRQVVLYQVSWPWDEAETVLTNWQNTAPSRSSAFNEDLSTFSGWDGKTSYIGIHLTGVYLMGKNQTGDEAKQAIQEELSTLGGDLQINDPSSYATVYRNFVKDRVYRNFSLARTLLTIDQVPAKIIVDRINAGQKIIGNAYLGLQLMGGKISRVSSRKTAFYPRKAKFFVDIFNFWDSVVNSEANQRWNRKTWTKLYSTNGPYVYLGFPIPEIRDSLMAYYGQNKYRLLDIKKAVDPLGLLRFPGSLHVNNVIF